MIGFQDALLLVASYSGILVGVFFPRFGGIFQSWPLYCMMGMLLLSFLSVPVTGILQKLRYEPLRISYLLFLKLILLPGVIYSLFRLLLPNYALAALLLSAASTGVIAPFFAGILPADASLVVVMLVASSLLMPLTLPALVQVLVGRAVEIPLLPMVQTLCAVVFIPFLISELLKKSAATFTAGLLRCRYPCSLLLFAVTNLGIFSKYSEHIRRDPSTIVTAFVVALVLAGIYLLTGLLFSWKMPLLEQLSVMICFGIMNNILMMVFSARFFSPREPTVAAMYTVPFYLLIVPLRLYQRWRLAAAAAQ